MTFYKFGGGGMFQNPCCQAVQISRVTTMYGRVRTSRRKSLIKPIYPLSFNPIVLRRFESKPSKIITGKHQQLARSSWRDTRLSAMTATKLLLHTFHNRQ